MTWGGIRLPEAKVIRAAARWWRLPLWILALFTGAKSFVDNPILGSRRLNRAGLHVWRLRGAHRLAWWRRSSLAYSIPSELKQQFDRDGFVVVQNFLPEEEFRRLRSELLDRELESREHQQGDTITRRVPIGPGPTGSGGFNIAFMVSSWTRFMRPPSRAVL